MPAKRNAHQLANAASADSRASQETEKGFQAAVVELATLLGWRSYHTHDSRRSEAGYPDLTLVRGSRLLFVELKTARGVVSAAQWIWLGALARTCAEVYVWRPGEWAAIEDTLKRERAPARVCPALVASPAHPTPRTKTKRPQAIA